MKVRECVENSKNQVYNNYPNTSLKVNLKDRCSFYLTMNGTRRLGINWPSWLKITGWPRRRGRRSSCRRWGSDWICKLNNRDFSYILGGLFWDILVWCWWVYNFGCSRRTRTALPWWSPSNGLKVDTRWSLTKATPSSKSSASSAPCTDVLLSPSSRPHSSRFKHGPLTKWSLSPHNDHSATFAYDVPCLCGLVLPLRDPPNREVGLPWVFRVKKSSAALFI